MALHSFNGLFQLTTGRDVKKVLKCIREQKERRGGEEDKDARKREGRGEIREGKRKRVNKNEGSQGANGERLSAIFLPALSFIHSLRRQKRINGPPADPPPLP